MHKQNVIDNATASGVSLLAFAFSAMVVTKFVTVVELRELVFHAAANAAVRIRDLLHDVLADEVAWPAKGITLRKATPSFAACHCEDVCCRQQKMFGTDTRTNIETVMSTTMHWQC